VVKIVLAGPGKPYDLILICIIAALAVLLSVFSTPSIVLALLAFICVFFAPGYALVSAMFPGAKANPPEERAGGKLLDSDISLLERAAAAIVLSLVMFAIGGISLSWAPSGLNKPAVLMEVMGLTIGFSALAIYRRASLPSDQEFALSLTFNRESTKLNRAEQAIVVLAALGVMVAGLYAVGAIPGAIGPEPHTEFYITGPDGKLSSLPQTMSHINNATLRIGVVNHMFQAVNYNLTVGLKSNGSYLNSTALDWSETLRLDSGYSYYRTFTVLDGDTWVHDLAFNFTAPGVYQIYFTLTYLDSNQDLWLWITVR
jgi:uncharacterized membrane protein